MASKKLAPLVMWDTCTLVWCLDHSSDPPGLDDCERDYRQATREAARDMVNEATSGQIRIAISTMAIAETSCPDNTKSKAEQDQIIRDFIKHSWIVRISLGIREAECT